MRLVFRENKNITFEKSIDINQHFCNRMNLVLFNNYEFVNDIEDPFDVSPEAIKQLYNSFMLNKYWRRKVRFVKNRQIHTLADVVENYINEYLDNQCEAEIVEENCLDGIIEVRNK